MKRILTQLLACSAVLLMWACGPDMKGSGSVIAGYDNSLTSWADIVEEIEVIPLEVTENSLLSTVQKVEWADSMFIVLDSNMGVVCFDRNGKYKGTVSRKGRADNEYIRINTFVCDAVAGHILIVDSFSGKIMRFTPDGHLVSVTQVPSNELDMMHFGLLTGKSDLFQCNMLFNDRNDIFTLRSLEDQTQRILYSTPMQSANTGESVGVHPACVAGDGILFVVPFDNRIYRLDAQGVVSTAMTVATSQKIVPEEVLEQQKNFSIMTYFDLGNSDYFTGFTNIFAVDGKFMLGYFDRKYFLADAGSGKGTVLESGDENTADYIPALNIISSSDTHLIGVVQPYKLKQAAENCTGPRTAGIVQCAEELNEEESNPIILLYKLKTR